MQSISFIARAMVIGSFALGSAAVATAQPMRVNITSFNMGWWISQSEFGQLVAQCSEPARNWCDSRASAQCPATGKGLPPCNAYAEYYFPQPKAPGKVVIAPTVDYWEAKRRALDQTLFSTGADIAAFQEISGEAAARSALGQAQDDYAYCTSTDRDPQSPEAQRLVIAVRKSIFTISVCRTDQALAVEDAGNPGHFTRPALIVDLVGPTGRNLTVANLHLKSSCSSPAGQAQFDYRGAYLDMTNDENKNCPTLRKQVEPLERLIERETAVGVHFVILGDFNRKIDLELNRQKAGNTRVDGGSAKGIPASGVGVRLLWPEVNDADPAESELMLLFRQARDTACAKNEGLDHIAISKGLAAVNPGARAREVDLARFAGGLLPASDHCPLTFQLTMP